MPLDQSVMESLRIGAYPQLDPEVTSTFAATDDAIERRKKLLRDSYAWGLTAPLSGTRETFSKRAIKEITDPAEREWLTEEVGKIAQAQSRAKEEEYERSGFTGRFGHRAQQVGGAFAEAGTAMTGAFEDFRNWAQGRGRTVDEVKFKRQLESAKQGGDPSLGKDAPLSLKAAAGAAGMAPDLSAGLLAGLTAGPYAMFAYWTARLFPERNEDYLEMGLSPVAAATAGAVTAAAESAIEMINIDPTGTTKGAIAQPVKGVVRRGISDVIRKYGGKRLISVMEKSPVVRVAIGQALDALERTGVEVAEEGMQRGVRDVGKYLAALTDEEIDGPVFSSIAPAMWQEMVEAAPGIAALGGGAGAGMAIGESATARQEAKQAKVDEEIVKYAKEGKIPSRRKRIEWGLPEEGWESRKQRGEGVQKLASEIETEARIEEQARKIVEMPPEVAQETRGEAPEVTGSIEASAVAAAEGATGEAAVGKLTVPAGDSRSAASFEARSISEKVDPDKVEPVRGGIAKKATVMATEAKAVTKDLFSMVAPAHVSDTTRAAGHVLRGAGAKAAQQTQAARQRIGKLEFAFLAMSPEARLEFLDRMETGQQQDTPELNATAGALREELDSARDRVRKIGKLQTYMKDYFPHLWKHRADKDIVLASMGGKTFRPSSFLKKRKIPTIREGVEAGLELVTDNPVDLALIRIQQMNEYVAKTEAMDSLKSMGMAKFVPASFEKDYMPAGFEFVDDPAFLVQTSADVTVTEAYDKLLRDQLESVAGAIGISHERIGEMKAGIWGTAAGKKVKTKFAGPLSVFAHEIGHVIGDTYGLTTYMEENVPNAKQEMTALAQLRFEGMVPSAELQKYVESVEEKEAVILEAWLSAPEKMAEVAPNVTEAWKEFLERNEQLAPLLMLDRSVVLGTGETTIEQAGVRVLGRWAVPSGVAKMIRNHLSPGLRGNKNLAVKTGYKLARNIGNAMNQASLSLSFFHGLNVMTDAIASQYALGLQQIARGKFKDGLGNVVHAAGLVQPGVKALAKGDELVRAMGTDLDQITNPELKKILETIIRAGGRSFMDQQYHNHSAKALVKSIRDIRFGEPIQKVSAAVRIPANLLFAGLEASAWPVMQYLVPRLKLGVFYYQAEDVYRRAEEEGLDEFQVTEQLSQAWDSVDNRMGQLGYDNLFWNQYLKDVSMLAIRSVGWNLGSIREFGGAITDVPTFQARMARGDQFISRKMAYFMGAAMTYAQLGAIIMYLMTGEGPKELKDYFFPKTGRQNRDGSDERISLPTYAKDWVAWSTDPIKAIKHKMHPLWGSISDMLSNEDYFGTQIRNEDDPWMMQFIDTVSHGLESFIPFSVRNYQRMREAGEPIGIAVPLAALGISPAPGYITKTRAQKLATQFLVDRIPKGSRTAEEAAASAQRKDLLKRIRSGEVPTPEELAGLTQNQLRRLGTDSRLTPFQSMFSRLTFAEALNVYVVCNEEERAQVGPIVVGKASRAKDVTDDERRLYFELFPE